MVWNSIGSMFYLGCQWLITILVVRLSSDYYSAGVLALGMSIANIFNPIGYYKIRTFQVSDLTNEYSSRDYICFRLITTSASLAAMLAYSWSTCNAEDIPSIMAYGAYSCGPVLVDVLHGIDQKFNRMDYIGKSLMIRGALSLFSFSAGMLVTNSLFQSLCLMTVSTYLAILFYDVPTTKKLEQVLRPAFELKRITALLVTCFPLVLALLLGNSAPSLARQILADVYGNSNLGAYASVAAPIAIVQMGAQYIYAPLIGSFAKYSLSKNGRGFICLLLKTIVAIVGLTAVLVAFFLICGENILAILYGDSIREFSYLLTPLILCTSITALVWFAGDLLVVVRKTKENLICYALCFMVSLATASPLLEQCGLNGASYCLIAGFAAGLLYSLFVIIRYCRQISAEER